MIAGRDFEKRREGLREVPLAAQYLEDDRRDASMFDLPRQLRSYREWRGLTQDDVSHKTGLAVGSISDWERGVRSPNVSKLAELAECYGVTIDEILNRDPKAARESAPAALIADSSIAGLLIRATEILEFASRQEPEEAKRQAIMALGLLQLVSEEANRTSQ
jgi:transcriptional regulator with XRE-family HTH domain